MNAPKRIPDSSILLIAAITSAAMSFVACNDDSWPSRSPTVVDSVGATSVKFWPPREYALAGDFLSAEVNGLQTAYDCARVLSLDWVAKDSGATRTLRPVARVELPAVPNCALGTRDTVVETTAPAAGTTLYLRGTGSLTDSLRVIAGTGVVEGFAYVRNGVDTLKSYGRFIYRDSTAGHPTRTLRSDSIESCEILQAAIFRRIRNSDTISVYWRTLYGTTLPSCTGYYADTVNVVVDKYGFP